MLRKFQLHLRAGANDDLLGFGVAGYHFIAGLPWLDAANVFASLCALFSGVVFISLMGLLLSPIAHRVLHKFHLSDEDMNDKKSRKAADSRNQDTR